MLESTLDTVIVLRVHNLVFLLCFMGILIGGSHCWTFDHFIIMLPEIGARSRLEFQEKVEETYTSTNGFQYKFNLVINTPLNWLFDDTWLHTVGDSTWQRRNSLVVSFGPLTKGFVAFFLLSYFGSDRSQDLWYKHISEGLLKRFPETSLVFL